MTDGDRKILADTVQVINGLRQDMQEFRCETQMFRGEMREFKDQSLGRLSVLESDQSACQKDPTICATARLLEQHLQGHKGGKNLAVSLWAVCVSTLMCVFTIAMNLLKGGKP